MIDLVRGVIRISNQYSCLKIFDQLDNPNLTSLVVIPYHLVLELSLGLIPYHLPMDLCFLIEALQRGTLGA